jgi:hypothetical protein
MKLDYDMGEALYARKLAENETAGTRIVCDEICDAQCAKLDYTYGFLEYFGLI